MAYACRAAVMRNGVPVARCRNDEMTCSSHQRGAVLAPRPNVVEVKFNLNPDLTEAFEGLAVHHRTVEESERLGELHEAEAEKLRRTTEVRLDPRTMFPVLPEETAAVSKLVRTLSHNCDMMSRQEEEPAPKPQVMRDSSRPEDKDSGTPVFGREGVRQVTFGRINNELVQNGFVHVGARLMQRHGRPTQLVLTFMREELVDPTKPKGAQGWDAERHWRLVYWMCDRWSFELHVWANPVKENGRVVSTLNFLNRRRERPKYVIRYRDGDWGVEQVR